MTELQGTHDYFKFYLFTIFININRPSASEVLQDPYFQEDGPQDTIQVSQSQLTKGGEAPQGDTPQDISVVHDEASILPPEQSVSADEKGHASSSPPPEQSVTDTSYGMY